MAWCQTDVYLRSNSHAAIRLGQSLFPLFALALDLPENFFDDKTTKPAAIMRLLHYPPQPAKPLDKILGIGAHTEYVILSWWDLRRHLGADHVRLSSYEVYSILLYISWMISSTCSVIKCFTILWQDSVSALQVMNADGKWIDAVPIKGTLVLKYVTRVSPLTELQ